ncbi:MAG TPA: four helix bundle protein [Mucilaginibacter sp.]|nr:four helix bundle protein [Mucilaginibacter sp.]
MLKHNFRQLRIWIDSVELTTEIYLLTQNFSSEHKFGLASQLYRSAVSIPSNIAEGSSRKSDKEFGHFLTISLGSAFELETQLTIAEKCKVFPEFDYQLLISRVQTLQRQIAVFSNTI